MTPQKREIAKEILKKFKRWFSGFTKCLVGFLCCWSPLTAPLLTGWLNRYMQRSAVQLWIKNSTLEDRSEIYKTPEIGCFKFWPKWSSLKLDENASTEIKARWTLIRPKSPKPFLKALSIQYCSGLSSLMNTWLLTLPFACTWLWMWWAGWNLSFSRMHEEQELAPMISLLSIAGFCVIMLYLPIAQARQAMHEKWHSFFDIRAIRIIASHVRLRLFIFAFFCAIGSAGLMLGTKIIPATFEQTYALDLTNAASIEKSVFRHFFFTILCFFSGLIVIKRMNARIYAIGVLKALQSGALSPDQLAPIEKEILIKKLKFKQAQPGGYSKVLKSSVFWPIRKVLIILILGATLSLWGSVVLSVYFGQFMNHSYPDWLNIPLIQMPYIRVPDIHPG